jgi:hypothetical protein
MDLLATDIQKRQLELEEKKIEVEHEKLKVERYKARWAAIGSIVPLVVALATVGYSLWSLQETARTQFEAKVAELAMAGEGPVEAKNRAKVLAAMFGDLLPHGIDQRLSKVNPEDFGSSVDPDLVSKKEIFAALAAHPADRAKIVSTWRALFPKDGWIDSLDAVIIRIISGTAYCSVFGKTMLCDDVAKFLKDERQLPSTRSITVGTDEKEPSRLQGAKTLELLTKSGYTQV